MKTRTLVIVASMACLSSVLFSGCKNKPKTETSDSVVAKVEPPAALTQEQLVQRGNYLVTALGGCGDCHSPKIMHPQGPEPNMARMLSGYQADSKLIPPDKNALKKGWLLFTPDLNAFVGPWGVSYAANITSDNSGIGAWPEENFFRAVREGKYMGVEGGRTLLPPMPWQNFATVTDEDIKAIYAYLKTTPPVNNVVPMAIAPNDIK